MPALLPFTFHWYVGVIPSLVLAVTEKLSEPPAQTELVVVPMEIVGVTEVLTIIETEFDVAMPTLGHTTSILGVSSQVITSLFIGV